MKMESTSSPARYSASGSPKWKSSQASSMSAAKRSTANSSRVEVRSSDAAFTWDHKRSAETVLSRQQCLYFFPLPHPQGSFLPSLVFSSADFCGMGSFLVLSLEFEDAHNYVSASHFIHWTHVLSVGGEKYFYCHQFNSQRLN